MGKGFALNKPPSDSAFLCWIVTPEIENFSTIRAVLADEMGATIELFHSCDAVLRAYDPKHPPAAIVSYMRQDSGADAAMIKHIKSGPNPPAMISFYNPDTSNGITQFLAGADDIVAWPGPLEEAAARLCVRLGADPQKVRSLAALTSSSPSVLTELALTPNDKLILQVLFDRRDEIVTRDELSHAVDRRPWEYGDRKFDVHVASIRKKLEKAYGEEISVSTIRLAGYRLSVQQMAG